MYRIAFRIAAVGFILYALDVGCHAQAATDWQAEPKDLPSPMPKVGVDTNGETVEQLPSPHELWSETMGFQDSYLFQPSTRINRYEIWQFYAVGHQGRFRPRVIYSPYGSFYLDDGRPYPWIDLHPLDFMPYAISP